MEILDPEGKVKLSGEEGWEDEGELDDMLRFEDMYGCVKISVSTPSPLMLPRSF